jgi:hypothetical protein
MKIKRTKFQHVAAAVLALAGLAASPTVRADEVTDWNGHMLNAIMTARVGAAPAARLTAMVQSAVFDAVNGVHKRYTPVHVPAEAPPGASARAAAIQAAYGVLVNLFPTQQVTLDAKRFASLAALDEDGDEVFGQSVERGLAWGQHVADEIWTWRSTDGFFPAPPPFLGTNETGVWRRTPPGFLAGATPQLAYTTPWVINSPADFLPPGPPALGSAQYAADYQEVQIMGRTNSAVRTADETLFCVFWAGNTPGFWNRAAVDVAERHGLSLLEKARVLAAMNVAEADAGISCWHAKYTFVFWRPVTAIPLGDTDGNDATVLDAAWTPLITTPNHPEYPSGHSSLSGAAGAVLAAFFGDETEFSLTSETTPGVTRYYTSFNAAVEEAGDARVFGGIHFRSACNDAKAMGERVASYVLQNAFQRVHGNAPLAVD